MLSPRWTLKPAIFHADPCRRTVRHLPILWLFTRHWPAFIEKRLTLSDQPEKEGDIVATALWYCPVTDTIKVVKVDG